MGDEARGATMAGLPQGMLDTIIQGDALDVLRSLPDACVDAVVTDPPYFLPAEHYQTRTKWARSLSDLSIIEHFVGSVFIECRRVLKPEGALLTFCDGQSYPVMYAKAYRLFDRLTDVVWDKGQIGMGRGVRRQHELMLVGVPASFAWGGWTRSVVRAGPVPSRERTHPAEKPVDLLRQLLRLVTPPGGSVLDPFAGSGTTLLACQREGAHFLGIEREAEYVKIARARLDEVAPIAREASEASEAEVVA